MAVAIGAVSVLLRLPPLVFLGLPPEPRFGRNFYFVLAYIGCRISTAIKMTAQRTNIEASTIIYESFKKRRRGALQGRRTGPPVPATIRLDLQHVLRHAQKGRGAIDPAHSN